MHWNGCVVKTFFNFTFIPYQPSAVAKHFVALSTNAVSGHAPLNNKDLELYPYCIFMGLLYYCLIVSYCYILLQPKVKDFGIDTNNMFEFWDVSL